ncbi:Ca2+:H+ antiporter [Fusarium oxysporum f. sp. conglutinans race 2 54008]|nr:Ca2+:H+ antiporter [Fusarium oxysporum f. sp. conglutinans race 2 54008]
MRKQERGQRLLLFIDTDGPQLAVGYGCFYQAAHAAVSVLVVTYTIQDGKSNYLEGAMRTGLYIIIALAFYATPSDVMDPGK